MGEKTRLEDVGTSSFEEESFTVLLNNLTTDSTSNESQVIYSYTKHDEGEGEESSSE